VNAILTNQAARTAQMRGSCLHASLTLVGHQSASVSSVCNLPKAISLNSGWFKGTR